MNSHSNGCTERVTMSRWSWRSLRISAWAMATAPAAVRDSGPFASASARRSAEAAGDAAPCADIGEPPFLRLVDATAGHRREDLLERVAAVALQQLVRLSLLDQMAHVHDRQALAVALGLLHDMRGEEDRRACLRAQRAEVLPHHPPRRRVQA